MAKELVEWDMPPLVLVAKWELTGLVVLFAKLAPVMKVFLLEAEVLKVVLSAEAMLPLVVMTASSFSSSKPSMLEYGSSSSLGVDTTSLARTSVVTVTVGIGMPIGLRVDVKIVVELTVCLGGVAAVTTVEDLRSLRPATSPVTVIVGRVIVCRVTPGGMLILEN